MIDMISIFSGGKPFFGSYSAPAQNIIASAGQLPSDLASAPQVISNWLQQYDSTLTVPPTPPNFYDGLEFNTMIQINSSFNAQNEQENLKQTPQHTVEFTSPVFELSSNTYMICADIYYKDQLTATSQPIVQPADQSTWGNQLPPGTYSSLTINSMDSYCFMSNGYINTWNTDYGGSYSEIGN